ncbi:hypothetical protein MTP99_010082 [Tenebrio molitor]|nr:hypothetical protein MTP99_010082 [Tenebrio molitor]
MLMHPLDLMTHYTQDPSNRSSATLRSLNCPVNAASRVYSDLDPGRSEGEPRSRNGLFQKCCRRDFNPLHDLHAVVGAT